MSDFRKTKPFFVQAHPREVWHVETPGDPERMLCGTKISVESSALIQHHWGLKKCMWCSHELERMTDA